MKKNDDFEFEKKLDEMLRIFFNSGTHPVELSKLPKSPDNNILLSMLSHRKFIEPMMEPEPNGERVPIFNLMYISDAGVNFKLTSSFVSEAKRKQLEDKRWDREFRKIRSDNVLSFIAILISIAALLFAYFKP